MIRAARRVFFQPRRALFSTSAVKKTETLYPSHIPTTLLQKAILAAGSSVMGLYDPWRADMVAVNGEVTGGPALQSLRARMRAHPEGRRILEDRPRLSTRTVDFDHLRELPPDTVGRTYAIYNDVYHISPDSREEVRFVDDEDLAFVIQRYREIHDVVHSMLEMPTNMVGEVAVKWVEALQTGLPMCIGGAIFGPLRFTTKQANKFRVIRPWVVDTATHAELFMNVYFEERWEQSMEDFRREMNYQRPPK